MKNDNILKIDLSPTGELPVTHKMCVMAVPEEKAKELMVMSTKPKIVKPMKQLH